MVNIKNGKASVEFFFDSVGRRRKLSDNTMKQICKDFETGTSVSDLATTWGVSESLIRSVTYHTMRSADAHVKAKATLDRSFDGIVARM